MTEPAQATPQVAVHDGKATITPPQPGEQQVEQMLKAPPGHVPAPEPEPKPAPPQFVLPDKIKQELQARGINPDEQGINTLIGVVDKINEEIVATERAQAEQRRARETQTAQGQVKAKILEPIEKILAKSGLPEEAQNIFRELFWAASDGTLRMSAGITQAEVKKARDAAAEEWNKYRQFQKDPRFQELMPIADEVLDISQQEGLNPDVVARILAKFPDRVKPSPARRQPSRATETNRQSAQPPEHDDGFYKQYENIFDKSESVEDLMRVFK